MTRRRRGALTLFGVATFFAFPHEIPFTLGTGWPESIDLGLGLAWLVPAALVVGIEGLDPRRAARVAFLASFAAHTVFFYWFTVVTLVYGGMPLALGVLAPLVPALYVAPFTALFAGLHARGPRRGPAAIALGAALWVALDWLRGHLMGGFPWATLGYALHGDTPLLAHARWGGVYVLSFVAAAVGIALARAFLDRDRTSRRDLLATVALVVGLHVAGAFAPAPNAGPHKTIRVAAIQGNIDQAEKWDAARRERILTTYLRLSEEAAEGGIDWIVWPETALPGIVENDAGLRAQLERLARRHDATLVVGGMGVEIDYAARRFSAFFDSAFQFDPDGEMRDRYDKTHLVPFGEFVPLRALLGRFFQSLATGLSSNDVSPGPRPRNMALHPEAGVEDRLRVGVPICYELLFPHLVRHFGAEGAGALLAITNDAWYGRTGAPHQFLAMTAMRAAENGLPTVRAANTGVSALIDATGRVRQRSPLFEEAVVKGTIEVPLEASPTLYARVGDVFAGLCTLAWVGSGVWRRSRERAGAAGVPTNEVSAETAADEPAG